PSPCSSLFPYTTLFRSSPFFLIMYLAALKSVPEQLYEAAAIDGATPWQRFWHITLPMMRNIIAITVLFSLIVTFANFDIVQIMRSEEHTSELQSLTNLV